MVTSTPSQSRGPPFVTPYFHHSRWGGRWCSWVAFAPFGRWMEQTPPFEMHFLSPRECCVPKSGHQTMTCTIATSCAIPRLLPGFPLKFAVARNFFRRSHRQLNATLMRGSRKNRRCRERSGLSLKVGRRWAFSIWPGAARLNFCVALLVGLGFNVWLCIAAILYFDKMVVRIHPNIWRFQPFPHHAPRNSSKHTSVTSSFSNTRHIPFCRSCVYQGECERTLNSWKNGVVSIWFGRCIVALYGAWKSNQCHANVSGLSVPTQAWWLRPHH